MKKELKSTAGNKVTLKEIVTTYRKPFLYCLLLCVGIHSRGFVALMFYSNLMFSTYVSESTATLLTNGVNLS